MNRKDRIASVRNWLKSCKQEAELGKKLSPDTFDKIIKELDDFVDAENNNYKSIAKHLIVLKSKVSNIIEDIITTETSKHDNRDTTTGKKT